MKKQIKRITAVAAAAALAISFTFPAELGLADLGVGAMLLRRVRKAAVIAVIVAAM